MFHVNKELLPLKGHYFFFNAGTAPLYPTMPVYAKQLGLSSVVVGTIYTIFPLCGVIAKPFVGALGDTFRAHKKLLILCELLIMTSYFAIQYVPAVPTASTDPSLDVQCADNSTFMVCPHGARGRGMATYLMMNNVSSECDMQCSYPAHLSLDNCDFCKPANSSGHVQKRAFAEDSQVKPGHSPIIPYKSQSRFIATAKLSHSVLGESCFVAIISQSNDSHRIVDSPQCSNPSVLSCVSSCRQRPLHRLLKDTNVDVGVTAYWQFWLFFVLLFISWVSTTVSVSLTDTVCVEVLGRQSRNFGNQRLFGSAGWGLLAIASGFVVDAASDGSEIKNYTPAFYLMLGPLIIDVLSTYFLKYEQTTVKSRNIFKDVGHLFLNVRVVVFMIWCTFIGVCFGMIWNFLFWYMEELADLQGGDAQAYIKTIEGLVGGVQCFLGEVPSYFLSGWVLQRIGHGHAMSLVLFLAGARFLLYSVISDPWYVLPVSVLQGMNGLFFPTMTSYAKIVAEPGTEATVQGVVSALTEGVGVALGSFLGGYFIDLYGGRVTFQIFGTAAMIMTACNIIAQWLLERYFPQTRAVLHQNENEKVNVEST